jgi:hypothetical protein
MQPLQVPFGCELHKLYNNVLLLQFIVLSLPLFSHSFSPPLFISSSLTFSILIHSFVRLEAVTNLTMHYILLTVAFASTVYSHGIITSPPPRQAGQAMKAACGEQSMFSPIPIYLS